MFLKTRILSLTEQLAERVAERLAERIRSRLLAPGARLASVRLCAHQQGVSTSTVVAAYDTLLALSLVEARRKRRFHVRQVPTTPYLTPAALLAGYEMGATDRVAVQATPVHQVPVHATALVRGVSQGVSDKPQPGLGAFPADWQTTSFLGTALRRVTQQGSLSALSLQYGEPAGEMGLRQALSQKRL